MRRHNINQNSKGSNTTDSAPESSTKNRINEHRGGVRDCLALVFVGTVVVGGLALMDVQVAVHVVSLFALYVAGRLLLRRKT